MVASDGSHIDSSLLKKIVVSIDFTDMGNFSLSGWESIKGSKTFKVELLMKHYQDICMEIFNYKSSGKKVVDIFEEVNNESRTTRW